MQMLPFCDTPFGIPLMPGNFDNTPVGSVITYAGDWSSNQQSLMQQGWMLCDGSQLPASDYTQLFIAIGTQYTASSADPVTHFNVPNYQGYFLRGVDPDGTIDKDQASRTPPGTGTATQVGSQQTHAVIQHEHHYQLPTQTGPGGDVEGAVLLETQSTPTQDTLINDETSDLVSANETRPSNVYVNFLIKFMQAQMSPLPPGIPPSFR